MKKNHLIIIIVLLVIAIFVLWFKMNYQITKIPKQSAPPTASHQMDVTDFAPTSVPGLDPTTESKGPTYPPPSS